MNVFYKFYVDLKFVVLQQLTNVLTFLLIVIGCWVVQRYLIDWIIKKIVNYYDKRQMTLKKEIWEHINKSLRHLIFCIGILIALSYALGVSLFSYEPLFSIFKSVIIFYVFQGFYQLVSYFGNNPEALKNKTNLNIELMLFPFFARIIKVFVFFIGFAMIMHEWGYQLGGIFAGLGIGGLALSLGAKDSLSHIFAGITMAIDKPFAIGDLISTDANLEGYVEDMNFRSTRIRTLDKALVSVPNAVIANQYIYNWTRRQNRRVRFFLGLTHGTDDDKLKIIIERIHNVVKTHPHVEEDSVTVAFDSYTPNSLEVLVLYITDTSDFKEYMVIKEELNYEIKRILNEENVSLSLPSQSIYFKNELTTRDLSDNTNYEKHHVEKVL